MRKGAKDSSCQVMHEEKKNNLKENKCQQGAEEERNLRDAEKAKMEAGHYNK